MNTQFKLEEHYYGKPVKDHIRDFAALLALVIVLIALYKFKTSSDLFTFLYALALANVLILISNKNPIVIYPFWRFWMLFGALISGVMSVVVLTTIWIVMLTPLAIFARLFGLATIKVTKQVNGDKLSYWQETTKPESKDHGSKDHGSKDHGSKDHESKDHKSGVPFTAEGMRLLY